MRRFHPRQHPVHFRTPSGALFLTWRLHRSQAPLRAEERQLVLDVIMRDDGVLGEIVALVVMDDHAHALLRPAEGRTVQRIVQTWKSVSSHAMTKDHGRIAPVWQRDYWDRSLMSASSIQRCTQYITGNPRRRWPGIDGYAWVYPRLS